MNKKIISRALLLFKILKLSKTQNRNYDYNSGFYSNMDKYKGVKDFLDIKNKDNNNTNSSKDHNFIDFPIDDQIHSSPISGTSQNYEKPISVPSEYINDSIFPQSEVMQDFQAYPSNMIGGMGDNLPEYDTDNKPESALNFGENLDNQEYVEKSLNFDALNKLMQKYLTPVESPLLGLKDGFSPVEDLDADKTVYNLNPQWGITDSGNTIYNEVALY